jgi:hypothetical protein
MKCTNKFKNIILKHIQKLLLTQIKDKEMDTNGQFIIVLLV